MNSLKSQIQNHFDTIQTKIAQDFKISKSFNIRCYSPFNPNSNLYNPYVNENFHAYFETKILHIKNYVEEVTQKLKEQNPSVFPINESNFTCHVSVILNYQFCEDQISKLKEQHKDIRSGYSALGPSIVNLIDTTVKVFKDTIIQTENVIVQFDCKRQVSADEPYISFNVKVRGYDI